MIGFVVDTDSGTFFRVESARIVYDDDEDTFSELSDAQRKALAMRFGLPVTAIVSDE
jgi:hypothetical protein